MAVRTRRVSTKLRSLRKANELTLQQVAITLGVSITKVQRMETGRRGLRRNDVERLLRLYQVPAEEAAELLALVGPPETLGWWQVPGSGLSSDVRKLIAYEDEARVLRDYQLAVVPPLLQTAEYTRALLSGVDHTLCEPDLGRQVAAQMTRQLILSRESPATLHCLIEENALRRPVGGAQVLGRQLQVLHGLAGKPNLDVRVVPSSRGAHPGLRGPMTLMEFDDGPSLVHQPTPGRDGIQLDRIDVRRAQEAWSVVEALALSPEESKAVLRGYAGDWAAAS